MIDSVVDLVEENVDLGGSQFSESINSRTLVLCACFTMECGSPGILKSMSASILSGSVSSSVYTDNSFEFGKSFEDSPGIIARRHHTDRKQMGLLKEQCAE